MTELPNAPTTFKVAAVQAAPVPFDVAGSVAKAIGLIDEAASQGATLIAFPETWLPGYPNFLWLGPPGWSMQFVPRYNANSITRDGPELKALAVAAQRAGIDVVMGYSERDHGSLYMGQSFISRDGSIHFTRRKLKPTHVERALFGEGDGSDILVTTNADGVRVGALNCYEHIQPLLKFAMHAQHEQIHVAGWPAFTVNTDHYYALSAEPCLAASRSYAIEGQCFVLAATSVINAETLDSLAGAPDLTPLVDPHTGQSGGGNAAIFGPDGRQLSAPIPHDQEGIVYADIDLGYIMMTKAMVDPVGHYARGDVLSLRVNRQPRRHISYSDDGMVESAAAKPPKLESEEPAG